MFIKSLFYLSPHYDFSNYEISTIGSGDFMKLPVYSVRVRTGPGKPGKSWNFVLPFSRTGKSWKMATGPGKSWKS